MKMIFDSKSDAFGHHYGRLNEGERDQWLKIHSMIPILTTHIFNLNLLPGHPLVAGIHPDFSAYFHP